MSESEIKIKKKKHVSGADHLAISNDDVYIVESHKGAIKVRLVDGFTEIAVYEGHTRDISGLALANNCLISYSFSECLQWNLSHSLKFFNDTNEVQVSHSPSKILFSDSSTPIHFASIVEISKNIFSVATLTQDTARVYLLKTTKK